MALVLVPAFERSPYTGHFHGSSTVPLVVHILDQPSGHSLGNHSVFLADALDNVGRTGLRVHLSESGFAVSEVVPSLKPLVAVKYMQRTSKEFSNITEIITAADKLCHYSRRCCRRPPRSLVWSPACP